MATLKGKRTRIYSDIDMDFNVNAVTGDIGKKLDVNAVKQSLKNLILTQPFEKPFHPEIGSQVYGLLFEPLDPLTAETMATVIGNIVDNWEPRVRLEFIKIDPDYDNNSYHMKLQFDIRGVNQPQTLEANLARLR